MQRAFNSFYVITKASIKVLFLVDYFKVDIKTYALCISCLITLKRTRRHPCATGVRAVEHRKSKNVMPNKRCRTVREILSKNNVVIPMKSSIFTDTFLSVPSFSLNLHFYKSILSFLEAQWCSQSWEIRINDLPFSKPAAFIYWLQCGKADEIIHIKNSW